MSTKKSPFQMIFSFMWILIFALSSCTGANNNRVDPTAVPVTQATVTSASEPLLPSEAELTALLKRMVDDEKRATGMVIGMIAPNEKIVVGYGRLNDVDDRAPNANSLFEIGSISKVFVGTLLADAVRRGEVQLDDPASKYLPPSVKMPDYNGTPITLLDLATHTSGLPKDLPPDFTGERTQETWVPAMYDFLSNYQLTQKPGTGFIYSNLGVTLLAHILELRTGIEYEALLLERICQPLGMIDTRITPTDEMLTSLATGHNTVLYPIDVYEFTVAEHQYVGGIVSSAEDMLRFASAAMGLEETPLLPAFQDATKPQRFAFGDKSGLAWRITEGSFPIINHAGHTFGMHAFLGFDPQRQVAVIVLANAAVAMDDIGPHLLHPTRYALETFTPRILPTPIKVDSTLLASYAGGYEMDGMTLSVSVSGDQLIMSIPDQDPITMFAQTEKLFVVVEYEATVSFIVTDGTVTALILDQAAASQPYRFQKIQ